MIAILFTKLICCKTHHVARLDDFCLCGHVLILHKFVKELHSNMSQHFAEHHRREISNRGSHSHEHITDCQPTPDRYLHGASVPAAPPPPGRRPRWPSTILGQSGTTCPLAVGADAPTCVLYSAGHAIHHEDLRENPWVSDKGCDKLETRENVSCCSN